MKKHLVGFLLLLGILVARFSFPALASEAEAVALQEFAENFLGPGFLKQSEKVGGNPNYCMRIGYDWYVLLSGLKRKIVVPEHGALIYTAPQVWISKDGKRIVLYSTDEGYLAMSFMVEQKTMKGLVYKSIYDGGAQAYIVH